MNFYVNNTEKITNFPESGINTLPYYNDGRTITTSNFSKITVDEDNVYYTTANLSFRTKNINNLVTLDSDGNIINQLKPYVGGFSQNLSLESFKIIYSDNTYLYAYIDNLLLNKSSQPQTLQIYRIFKRNYTIDPNFCLTMPSATSTFISVNSLKMFIYNNKYYIIAQGAGTVKTPYFYKDQNSSLGLYITKDKRLISNFKMNQFGAAIFKIKSYDGQIYCATNGAGSEINKIQYPKIFRLNNKNILDQSFYPFIDRYNNSSTAVPGSALSQVTDFAFVNDGIFIGGNFQSVGGDPCTGLAKIDYSGNRITGFNANLGFSISTITSTNITAVASSGSGVFIGGALQMYYSGDITKNRLLKLHDDGTLNETFTGFRGLSSFNVSNMLLSGDSLYVGGASLGSPLGIYGTGVFKLNANDGSFDPNFNIGMVTATPTDFKISGNSLYVSTTSPQLWYNKNSLGGITRTGVFKVNASNGEPDPNFQINFNPNSTLNVQGMAIKGNELHICGTFTGIEDKQIYGYAVVNTTDGKLIDKNNYFYDSEDFILIRNVNYDTDNLVIGASTTSNKFPFYITGYNSQYNSIVQIYDQNFIPETGISSQISFFNRPITNFSNTGIVFLANNTGLILSGNNVNSTFACALNLDNLNIDTTTFYLSGSPLNCINTIEKYNNDYFFGGTFTDLGCKDFTTGINYLTKTNSSGVIDKNFNFFLTGQVGITRAAGVTALKVVGDSLYGCGAFTGISGIRNFFKYNLTSGFLETGFNYLSDYCFFPQDIVSDNKNNIYVSVVNNYLSDSGNFFKLSDGYTRTSGTILKFNSGSYDIDPTFTNKHFNTAGRYLYFDDNKIYTTLISQGRSAGSDIYKINRKTRQIDSSNVYISGGQTQTVYDMYNEGNYLYIVGSFSGVNNTAITGFCRLNKSNLSVDTSFNFNIGSGIDLASPYKMVKKDNYLYCMGNFDKVNTTPITGLARFDLTNDTFDTSFKIDFSGIGLGLHYHLGADFSGNNLYLGGNSLISNTPALSIIDIQNKLLTFTGVTLEASASSSIITLENVGNGLIAGTSNGNTRTSRKYLLVRARGFFHLGYISGEINNPYTFFAGSTSATIPYFKYHQLSDSIFATQNTVGGNNNNVLGINPGLATSYFIIDENKKFIKNKFNVAHLSINSSLSSNIVPFVYNNELYMDSASTLLPKKDFPYQRFVRNITQRSIIKFNANFDDYEIII
jgi:hypothetical protein